MYEGAVHSSLLNFNPDHINTYQTEQFHITDILLDTNFLMRILNIQTEIETASALETFQSLQSLNIRFYVLPCTLSEISISIKNYLNDTVGYGVHTREYFGRQTIKTTGIFDAVQRGAATRTKLLELANSGKLKSIFTGMGINVIEEDEDVIISDEEIESLRLYKDHRSYSRYPYNGVLAKHDLSLIAYCRKRRTKRLDSFKDAKWWVLTNDFKLISWNQQSMDSSVRECIIESQISNLLWLCKRKEFNGGLINTMVTLANSNLLSPSEITIFDKKLQAYSEASKNDPDALDKIALVFASDCITDHDIKRVNEEEIQFEQLMNEKTAVIKKETDSTKATLEQKTQEADMLNQIIDRVSQYTSDIEVKEKERNTILGAIHTIKDKLGQLNSELDNLTLVNNYLHRVAVPTGRLLAVFYVLTLAILATIAIRLSKPVFEYITSLNIPESIHDSTLTAVYSTLCVALAAFLSVIITGEPRSPKATFMYLRDRMVEARTKRHINKKGLLYKGTVKEDVINDKIGHAQTELAEYQQNEINQKERLQELDLKIDELKSEMAFLIENRKRA